MTMVQSCMNLMAPFLVVVLMATSAADAAEYNVGNMSGWVVPRGQVNHFNNWAAEHKFNVGDTLVFNFVKYMHDVVQVSKSEYDACDAKHAIATYTNGPARIQLDTAGFHYFICSFPNHCKNGQRVAINVSEPMFSPAEAPGSPAASPEMEYFGEAPAPVNPSPSNEPSLDIIKGQPMEIPAAGQAPSPASSASTIVVKYSFVVFMSIALSFFLV